MTQIIQHRASVHAVLKSNMNPIAPSFEAMVGLALRGSNWQQLQQPGNGLLGAPVQEAGEDLLRPAVMTAKQKKKMVRFNKTVARDAGDVIESIEAGSIMPVAQSVSWDEEPELLCSYNWQNSDNGTNTIFVPGAPTKWQEPTLPITLEKDSGIQYADYNYARQPRDPYSPMFHALSAMNPNYRFNDVDVLADRNNLRVLLEFCQGKSNGPFRLNLFLVFNTLIIVRKEDKWWKACDGVSYGWNFESHFTRPVQGMEDATSHYRAIRYPLGPLNIVLRFEADAYDDGITPDTLTPSESTALKGTSAARPTFTFRSPIRVLQKGHIIPSSQMVELKTQKHDPMGFRRVQCQDQLWFGRTSLLFTGPYEGGTGVIKAVKYEQATERVKLWEQQNQESLRKLPALLVRLRRLVQKHGGASRALVLLREDKGGPLVVRPMKDASFAVGREAFRRHWATFQTPSSSQPGGRQKSRGGGVAGSGGGKREVVFQMGLSSHQGAQTGADAARANGHARGSQRTQPELIDQEVQSDGRGKAPSHAPRGPRGRGRGNANAPRGRGTRPAHTSC
ncbi:hypothetical protein NX059_009699 [Plenodomus lindquistii]|nr:hypothetical protein NX059_009699 [Plenodomus lindquistii]